MKNVLSWPRSSSSHKAKAITLGEARGPDQGNIKMFKGICLKEWPTVGEYAKS